MNELPRLDFAHLPTPVEMLPNLSAALGGPELFVKRDDQTGLGLGGNKTRKLEYLLADARLAGADTVITAGADQSNHCRQTAAAAARTGFHCVLVLYPPAAFAGQAEHIRTHPSGNLLLDHLFGAEVIWTEPEERDRVLAQTFEHLQSAGQKPYLIPYGGSNKIGAAAYAYALRELRQQQVSPDWVVVASSSGGTQAGLVLGARSLGFQGKILGISVDESAGVLQERVAWLANETAAHLGEELVLQPGEILVRDKYSRSGYGVVTPAEREALALFARTEGLLLDPVYTARAAAGLVDLIRQDFFEPSQTVLFWHTGGTPALFAERYQE